MEPGAADEPGPVVLSGHGGSSALDRRTGVGGVRASGTRGSQLRPVTGLVEN